jgi:pimeloyl-ACP methyl ester carboxylesterase
LFDKPGTGLSDPVAGAPTVEQRMGDIQVVMDAVGSERAALIGFSEGGVPCALFAATYPERVAALVLLSTTSKFYPGPDFLPELESLQQMWRDLEELGVSGWGEGRLMLEWAPSWKMTELHRRTAGIAERACASPGMARALIEGFASMTCAPSCPPCRSRRS